MAWRLAKSLEKFRAQCNAKWPNRSKKDDGTIGDLRHQARTSDHNAWIKDAGHGVVSAFDLTHDPKNGPHTWELAEYLRTKRDPRIKYVISNRRIFSSTTAPWQWRKYTGSNPHSAHMHVSVKSTKSHYDGTADWDLGPTAAPDAEASSEEDADSPARRPVLRRGDHGEDVQTVQRILGVDADGAFGPTTETAVKGFQRALGLHADGIVGPLTWEELDALEQIPTDRDWQRNITCTEFGGRKDMNRSAYENRWITDDELGVALPLKFRGDRPQVEVVNLANGKTVVCDIVDVGPWNVDDPYWDTGSRPQAETGKDRRGRKTNKAGIDLTPAAARAIGLKGLGKVNWAFAETKDEGETPETS